MVAFCWVLCFYIWRGSFSNFNRLCRLCISLEVSLCCLLFLEYISYQLDYFISLFFVRYLFKKKGCINLILNITLSLTLKTIMDNFSDNLLIKQLRWKYWRNNSSCTSLCRFCCSTSLAFNSAFCHYFCSISFTSLVIWIFDLNNCKFYYYITRCTTK